MPKLGFCGLGAMGAPMAGRLVDAGHDVAVWNRTRERATPLVERGAREAATPADAARGADAVITMLTGPEAVEQVVLGPHGIAEGIADGATLVEMSTIGVEAIRRLRERLPDGVALLDAPVLGSVEPARDGTLKVLVGGEPDVFGRLRSVLEVFGTPRLLGGQGAGAAMKLVGNATIGIAAAGLGEALALAASFGLPDEAVLDTLEGTALGYTASRARANLLSGRFDPRFALQLAVKDLDLIREAAAGVETPLVDAAGDWFDRAERAGMGRLDYTAVVDFIRRNDDGS